MTIEQARELHCGDEVFWNDPDEGRCSRVYKIDFIEVQDGIAKITEDNGSYLECYIEELS